MADPFSADRLVEALRAEGVNIVEYKNWRDHNRNHVGAWGPVNGIQLHHTVTSGTSGSVALCYDGRSDLPGPLCHGVIAKDGTCYLVGWGRANHAGGGDPDVLAAVIAEDYGDRPPATHEHQGSAGAVDGNARFIGFECINLGDGEDPWPPEQVEAMVRASAAICRIRGWSEKSVIGHLEWSDWKVDPRGVSMVTIRARVAERLLHTPDWNPDDPEDDMPEPRDLWTYTYEHGGVEVQAKTFLGRAYQHAREANQRLGVLGAQVTALSATVTTLAEALAAQNEAVDVDALIARIEERIEAITVRIEVPDA